MESVHKTSFYPFFVRDRLTILREARGTTWLLIRESLSEHTINVDVDPVALGEVLHYIYLLLEHLRCEGIQISR